MAEPEPITPPAPLPNTGGLGAAREGANRDKPAPTNAPLVADEPGAPDVEE